MLDIREQSTADLAFEAEKVLEMAISAAAKWPRYNSAHEGYGLLCEELKELADHVFMKQVNRDISAMRKEARDVAAVALRFAAEVCNEDTGRR